MDQQPGQARKVADDLRRRIVSGELAVGARLPARHELAAQYNVAEGSARDAVRTLGREGLVITRSGAGTFVRDRGAIRILNRTWFRERRGGSPFAADLLQQGREGTWTYASDSVQAPPEIRARLALDEPADGRTPDVMRTRYLFSSGGSPWMASISHEPLELIRGTEIALPEAGPLAGQGVTHRMAAIGIMVDDWREEVGARIASADEAKSLAIAAESIVLVVERSYMAGARVVECATMVLPADTMRLGYSGPVGE
ncbi:GntR family transcriptional regulator [Acrocarpospora sp. B8E8]|uniref:GntR family transcriptional regulator n=1 Tax=Acrocarpospora sp. B8E8 TaxID=3153572 RepID=UPI00325D724A